MDATANTVLMWLTFAGIVGMIVAYALERWAIELISIASLVYWLIVFWLVPKLFATATPLSTTEVLTEDLGAWQSIYGRKHLGLP